MWPEVTRALEEKRHELTLSDADVAQRMRDSGIDLRIFEILTLNFLEVSNIGLDHLPSEIGCLENMINLALQRNKIAEVPHSIGNLKNLKFLDMSFNSLTGFADSISNLKVLHTLNLSCNKLRNLPNLESLSSLVILRIDHNKLQGLPDGIYGLEHLMEIHAPHNEITEVNKDISRIETLRLVDLSNNQIKELPAQIADCPRLKDLNLKDNPLKDNRLKKMTSQCNTRSIMEYISVHSGEQMKGKKGKKKKQGKGSSKENETQIDARQIHVMKHHKDEKHVIFKDVMKGIRPYIICTVIKNLDLSDLQMYRNFIGLQTKLHEKICDSRTKATIATHNYKSLSFPLVYDAREPGEINIIPLGQTVQTSAVEYVKKLTEQKEMEEKRKKRQQSSGVYRFLDLIQELELYPCLMSENEVVSLPPVTNSDTTKLSPSICDIFVEVTSTVSLAACKGTMETLIEQLFQLGYISSPYADTSTADSKEMKGLILQQVRVDHEDGQLRAVYPSKADLKFESIQVTFVE